jgi:abequosyltransferase
MSKIPVLTLAIPTYNRAQDLVRLLEALSQELQGLEEKVSLVVSNNASTDDTQQVIDSFVAGKLQIKVLHQATNLGMDGNFCACVEQVDGAYFWLFGDDDLPVRGAIPALVQLLESSNPDLVFLESRWLPDVSIAARERLPEPLIFNAISRAAFSRRVHVWTTFLSGMIVKKAAMVEDAQALRIFHGTHISQMSWVVERLKEGTRFVYVRTPCVLATSGNTGGYSAVKVFAEHFPRIVRESLLQTPEQRDLAHAIVMRMVLMYLPELLWNLRLARAGKFESENVAATLRPQLGRHPLTFLLLLPVSQAPMPVARMVLRLGRMASRIVSIADRLRMEYSREDTNG